MTALAETPSLVFTVAGNDKTICVETPGRLLSPPEDLDLINLAVPKRAPNHDLLDLRYLIGRLHATDLAADRDRFIAFFVPGEQDQWRARLRRNPDFLARNRREAMGVRKFQINGWADFRHYTVVLTTRLGKAKGRRAYVFTSTPQAGWRRVSVSRGHRNLKTIAAAWRAGTVVMIPTDIIEAGQPRCG